MILQQCNQSTTNDTKEISLTKSAALIEEQSERGVNLHFSDGAKRRKIAAVDYVEEIRLEVDIDEYLDTLMHLESDIEEIITSEMHLSREALAKASDIFSRYGAFLGELPQFSELSYVVFTLSSVLRNTDYQSIEQNEKILYKMLVSVLDDLKNWKITNFITQDSLDIHYLDDSLLSSCSQLESLLNQKDTHKVSSDEDDDNDLELF